MGIVYLAEDRSNNNSQCVVKQLTNRYADPAEHAEAIRLFQREAAILHNLHHPGIVSVYDDYATEDGRYFLVMDYVPGKDLDAMVRESGAFTSDATVGIAIQCCEVLEYIHGQDPPVIYRDLKPSNLMLTPDGRVIFVDFGIARSFMPKVAATRVVTAGYSPPEQYFGKPETRSDLYSLGATLSHLVTGVRPKPLGLCAPGLLNPRVWPSLDALARRLTSHNIDERPPTAKAVRWELYRIYKEYHPEFEIPYEPGIREFDKERGDSHAAAKAKAKAEEPDIRSLARFRAGSHDPLQPAGTATTQGRQQQQNVSRSYMQPPSLWERVKLWFEMLMS